MHRIVADRGRYVVQPQDAEKLLELTQAMLAAAEQRDWDRLAGLEAERSRLIAACFGPARPLADTTAMVGCIRQMLDLDRKVIAIAEDGLRVIAGEIADLERGRRAHRAYGDAAK